MKDAMRRAAIAICVVLMTGCAHWRDQGMVDAARGLVPPETSETSWSDREGQNRLLTGDYLVYVHFDNGEQLAPEAVLDAVANNAADLGWAERYRCDRPGAWIAGYSRDKLKSGVTVWKPMVDDDNQIYVMRMGDGNAWPPEDCSRP